MDFKGRYFLKDNFSRINNVINLVNERKLAVVLESKIQEIKPDVVHSFVVYLCGVPILPVMEKFPDIKWIMSTWGSDLYYYRNSKKQLEGIKAVLPKLNYLFTDCKRDYHIALENGFKGKFLGVFPGGGGYDLEHLSKYSLPHEVRNTILIKGYQGKHGKCLEVMKAISALSSEIGEYKVKIFGADKEVVEYIERSELKDWGGLQCLGKIPHLEVLKLMGEAKVYIGNSSSDGIPNTLLEAIVMEAFPIQSNPGGATEELIEDGNNGLLISNPQSSEEIATIIMRALNDSDLIRYGVEYNNRNTKPGLERGEIKNEVLKKYQIIEEELNGE